MDDRSTPEEKYNNRAFTNMNNVEFFKQRKHLNKKCINNYLPVSEQYNLDKTYLLDLKDEMGGKISEDQHRAHKSHSRQMYY